jgi:prepilin-type N-terminal cleavage/methylation domain-containing protein
MLNWINRKMKRKGFTLIELVIVIAILGILIAIAVPRLAGFRDNAQVAADEATAETLAKAGNLYVATYGKDGESPLGVSGNTVDTKTFIETLIEADLLDGGTEYKPQQDGKKYEITYNDGEFTVKVVEE